jgi:hypothetical protein
MIDFGSPEMTWLSIANIALGAATLLCLALVIGAVAKEVVVRARKRSVAAVPMDVHSLAVPGLGTTMADGGDPVEQKGDKEDKEQE